MAPDHGIFAVADGMGGHVNGALASAMIADRLNAVVQDDVIVSPGGLKRCLEQANRDIWSLSAGRRQVTGSTIAALLVGADRYVCLWAGDSRIYHLRGDRMRQLSHDHSEVQELVDSGVLNAEDARSWPRRNVITRAVGVSETVDLECVEGPLADDDGFVLCSDGLTTLVDVEEIRDHALAHEPKQACDMLVDLAVRRGESDDVTVVIVRRRPDAASGGEEGASR